MSLPYDSIRFSSITALFEEQCQSDFFLPVISAYQL